MICDMDAKKQPSCLNISISLYKKFAEKDRSKSLE